jgi:hypothetical protein
VVFDRCEIHNIADDGLDISGNHIKVLYSKIHNLHGCGTDASCSGPCYNGHSDGLELNGVSDFELIGSMVYDVRSNAALYPWGSQSYDWVIHNNVFYNSVGASIYLQKVSGITVHNNVIWGRQKGNRYGGLMMGNAMNDLRMHNNIILNINYSHMGATYNPTEHDLDYNLFGMINSGEYSANANDLVADPQFAGIPMSGDEADHKGSDLTLEDFRPAASEALDTGTASGGVPDHDIVGEQRPQGGAWDRGAFEATP